MSFIAVVASSVMFGIAKLFKSRHTYYDYAGSEYAGLESCCACCKR